MIAYADEYLSLGIVGIVCVPVVGSVMALQSHIRNENVYTDETH